MTSTLDRLLARYEYGRLAPELFDIELRAAMQALGDERFELESEEAVVRLWNPELLEAHQRAFKSAVDAVDRGRFREAVRGIKACRRGAVAVRDLIAAAQAADLAENAATAVHDVASMRRLQRLPAVAASQQIVELARQTIVGGHYTRAARIAAICSRMAAALLKQREATDEEHEAVRVASADIRTLCDSTRGFAPPDEGDAATDGTLDHVSRILKAGYVRLALRLAAELQMELAGRRRFILLYQRRGAMSLSFGSAEEIRAVVSTRSWDGAFDHYCEVALAGHARAVDVQIARAASASAAFDAALESMAHQTS